MYSSGKRKLFAVLIMYVIYYLLFLMSLDQYLWSQPREKYIFKNYVSIIFDRENNIRAIYRSTSFFKNMEFHNKIDESKYFIFMYAFNSSKEEVWIYNFKSKMTIRSILTPLSNVSSRLLNIFSNQINFRKTFKIIVYLPFYGEIKYWNINHISEHQIQLYLPSIPCFILIYGENFYIHFFVNSFQKNINISASRSKNIFILKSKGQKMLSFNIDLKKIIYIIMSSLVISTFVYYIAKKKLEREIVR